MHRSRIPQTAARGAGTRESERGHRDKRRVRGDEEQHGEEQHGEEQLATPGHIALRAASDFDTCTAAAGPACGLAAL
jgi:hypothetical protein